MENSEKLPYFFEEEIKLIAYCPICEADLNPIKGKLVENKGDLNLVHMQCPKCKGYILALILKTANGLTSLGLITDLNFHDINKFKDQGSLTDEQVLTIVENFNKRKITAKIVNLHQN